MIHRVPSTLPIEEIVVNCFQNTTLVDDSQEKVFHSFLTTRCELLSEYYFSR